MKWEGIIYVYHQRMRLVEGSDDVFYVYEWCKKDSERKEMLILIKF